MGVHENRGDLKNGEEEIHNPTSVGSPINRDAVYLNENEK
jgi:hypothetical protein